MTNESKTRGVAKRGFGTAMVARLGEVDFASTEELAKVAGVTVEQAYSRLMFLQSKEGMVVSAGRGNAKTWSLVGKAPPPAPTLSEGTTPKESVVATFGKSYGWKPSLDRYEAANDVKVGDKLLVEYPESWRHTAFVTVTRAPDARGAAQCWDIRNMMFTYVPVTADALTRHNVRLARVLKEKDIVALENE